MNWSMIWNRDDLWTLQKWSKLGLEWSTIQIELISKSDQKWIWSWWHQSDQKWFKKGNDRTDQSMDILKPWSDGGSDQRTPTQFISWGIGEGEFAKFGGWFGHQSVFWWGLRDKRNVFIGKFCCEISVFCWPNLERACSDFRFFKNTFRYFLIG